MKYVRAVLAGVVFGLFSTAIAYAILIPNPKHTYLITSEDGSQSLYRAERVKNTGGLCLSFYNEGRVTALVCGQYIVVEQEQAPVEQKSESKAPEDEAPVGSARQES